MVSKEGERRIEYKGKIRHVILMFLLIGILAGVLSGCGREINTESEESSDGEVLPEEEGGRQDFDAESAEDEPLQDYSALQEELRPSILQIFCGDYRGSGVVWEITEEEAIVVSSAHLLKNGETCDVLCYAGVYYEAEVDRILEDCDIGFAVIPGEALKEDEVELKAVIPSQRNKEVLVQGEELVVYGSMENVAGDFVKGYLIKAESKIQFEGYDSEQPLMLGGIVRKKGEEGPVDAGMSGSGVFDRQGRLLGILAGGDGESGFAAVPVWNIVE